MNCEYCGVLLFPDDRYCPKCGAPNEFRKSNGFCEEDNLVYAKFISGVQGSVGNPLIYTYNHVPTGEYDYFGYLHKKYGDKK